MPAAKTARLRRKAIRNPKAADYLGWRAECPFELSALASAIFPVVTFRNLDASNTKVLFAPNSCASATHHRNAAFLRVHEPDAFSSLSLPARS